MNHPLTTVEKIRRLPWNVALNAFNNIFAQLTFFGSAFVLFLNDLGTNNAQIGFLLSLLPFFGIVALFIAPAVARFGYKRTFVLFFGIRKVVTACLLFVPAVLDGYGPETAMTLVSLVVMGFALCRAIAEVGIYPWSQEFIPNSIRGKHAAINDMMARITGMIAIGVGGYILGLSAGIDRYMVLFAIAVFFGALAVWSAAHLPGGAPTRVDRVSLRRFIEVFRDSNFNRFIAGIGLATLGSAPLAFLPLFMQNQVGLNDSAIVWLQIGTILGGFSATYLFGWASDRYGSKPVMLSGLYIKALLPIGWLLMPRNSEWSLGVALAIAAVWGIAEIAWALGVGRLLFVSVVPEEKKSLYMAVYYAAIGVIGGFSQIISGSVLDLTAGIQGQWLFISLDLFTPLWIGGLVLTVISIAIFSRVRAENEVSVGEFAGMFRHGNPVLALESLVRYYRAADERETVAVTERMSQIKSPLTVDELLEALKDPRFNVRFEAIISAARMGPEPRLVKALCRILDGTELSLSVIAAWALGRIGDPEALPTLRNSLNSPYRSIQAHAARALGTLHDYESLPLMIERLRSETDKGLRVAYASAIGHMQAREALPTLFMILETTENEGARMELALAIARVLGDEQHFIRLLRAFRADPGTAAAQEITAWRRRAARSLPTELRAEIDECAQRFGSEHLHDGAKLLSNIITGLPHAQPQIGNASADVLAMCAAQLSNHAALHAEYVILALHALHFSSIYQEK